MHSEREKKTKSCHCYEVHHESIEMDYQRKFHLPAGRVGEARAHAVVRSETSDESLWPEN